MTWWLGKWERRLRKLFTPRELRHMLHFPRGFLRPVNGRHDQWEIRWKGRVVKQTIPIEQLKSVDQRDCHIWATGPSAKLIERDLISKGSIIGLNAAIVQCTELDLVPDYYLIADGTFLKRRFERLQGIFRRGVKLLVTPRLLLELCKLDVSLLAKPEIGLLCQLNSRPSLQSVQLKRSLVRPICTLIRVVDNCT